MHSGSLPTIISEYLLTFKLRNVHNIIDSINGRKSTMIMLQTEMISFLGYDHILYVNIERGGLFVCFLAVFSVVLRTTSGFFSED